MENSLLQIQEYLERIFPCGTSRRKVIQIVCVVLVVEGLSVIFLFSYAAVWVGLISLFVGVVLLTLFSPRMTEKGWESESPGIRLIDYIAKAVGGEFAVMLIGACVISAVLLYNTFVSSQPEMGDIDTISIVFGLALLLHPLLYERFKIEMAFSIIFLATVVSLLVLPQVMQTFSSGSASSAAGDWYVHYMLAAPFAGILEALGVPASSTGNYVTLQFQDGSIHTLSISAYCAGLYSFSIFLAAFFAFVLVFETLSRKMSALVLAAGLLIAYLGNIFRMVVIGIVGYYRGLDNLLWAHENAGWIVFLAWSGAFWFVILGYADRHRLAN